MAAGRFLYVLFEELLERRIYLRGRPVPFFGVRGSPWRTILEWRLTEEMTHVKQVDDLGFGRSAFC